MLLQDFFFGHVLVGKGLPRQEHESLMQDGLRIDGKL